MDTKHRPSTYDDGVNHSLALPKITNRRVPESIYKESIGWSGWNIILIHYRYNTVPMIISSQLEKVGRSEALRAGHRERGQLEWKTNKKACLGWKGRDCRRGTWRRLPAVLKTFEHDSGDIQALRSRSIMHRYVLNIHCCGCHCSCCWRRATIEVAFFG